MFKGAQRDHTSFLFFESHSKLIHHRRIFPVVVTSCWSQLNFQSGTQVLHHSSHWHTISKGFVTSLPASISVCISSNDEYHTSFVATPDHHLYATHCASEHMAEACSDDFFSAASPVKVLATTTPRLFLNDHISNPSSEKNNCLLNNSTVQPQPVSLFLSKGSSFHCGAIWATVFLMCFLQLLLLTYFHKELVLI